MRLSHFSVDRPVTVTMLIIGVILIGAVSFSGLSVDLMPEIDLPIAIVSTSYSGASPEEIESMVTRPLEETLATTSAVEGVSSYSSVGSSLILLEFDWDTDMSEATLEMRERIDLVREFLPADATSPMVIQVDPNMMPIMQLAVTGQRDLEELKTICENEIVGRLERIEGVASVGLSGGRTREITIVCDPDRLHRYGVTMAQVMQAVQMDNADMSAGLVEKGARDLVINVEGRFSSPREIGDVTILTAGGPVRVRDVAEVVDGHREISTISKMNGNEAISLSVSKQSGANTVAVAGAIHSEIRRLSGTLPDDLRVDVFFDSSVYILQVVRAVAFNMMLGGLLAALVLFLFLRDARSTLTVALSMPISVIATFVLMYFTNLTVNIMTLGGLGLGIGMMLDNSIVVLENIFRHNQMGKERPLAAKVGASEVTAAIVASTLTTIAVFFPIAFTGGMTSVIFSELSMTVSFSLLGSLFVALTVTPMLASRMIRADAYDRAPDSRLRRMLAGFNRRFVQLQGLHGRFLRYSLQRKKRTVAVYALVFFLSLGMLPLVGQELFPPSDEGQISIRVSMPTGTRLAETASVVEDLEEFIYTIPEVEMVAAVVGSSGMGFSLSGDQPNTGGIYLYLYGDRARTTAEVVEEIRQETARIPGAEVGVSAAESMGMGMGSGIEINVRGDELSVLRQITDRIAGIVESVPGTREVSTSFDEDRPEMRVVVDRARASAHGLSTFQVGQTVRMAIGGSTVTRYSTGTGEIDVRIRLADTVRSHVQDIGSIQVMSPLGYPVPLSELARIENVSSPGTIIRSNQVRQASVSGDIYGRDVGSVTQEIQTGIEGSLVLPEGYTVEFGGVAEQMEETFTDLLLVVALAIALVYMILAAQFESLLFPFIIMFTLPFTLTGVVWALLLTGHTINVVSFIGIIMLVGIVVNNAIVLIDYINRLKAGGMDPEEAVLEAAAVRLRPIVMTSLTTILAMIPIAMAIGNGGEIIAPMGVAIVGGLLVSSLVTLVLIPVIYRIFDTVAQNRKDRRAARRARRVQTQKEG